MTCPVCGYRGAYDDEMDLRCSHEGCENYGEVIVTDEVPSAQAPETETSG
ncbi:MULTISPECIES: hypothetical protein [Halococcus]|nr:MULTISPECIES: hypothetical protein [Halococcus]